MDDGWLDWKSGRRSGGGGSVGEQAETLKRNFGLMTGYFAHFLPRPTSHPPLRTKDQDVGSRERKGRRFASSISSPRTIAPLLLTGDERFISEDGKSRTVYSLDFRSMMDFKVTPANVVVLEETYGIENVKKKISLVASLNK